MIFECNFAVQAHTSKIALIMTRVTMIPFVLAVNILTVVTLTGKHPGVLPPGGYKG